MALSANRSLSTANESGKKFETIVIRTGSIIYQHAWVARGATAGTAHPCANLPSLRFAGIAVEASTRVFPITGDGTKTVDVASDLDVLSPITGFTVGQTNDAVYAAADDKGFNLSTLGPQIGVLQKFVSATQGWIRVGATALSDPT